MSVRSALPEHIMNEIEASMPWDLFVISCSSDFEDRLIHFEDAFSDVSDISEIDLELMN